MIKTNVFRIYSSVSLKTEILCVEVNFKYPCHGDKNCQLIASETMNLFGLKSR